VSVPMCMFLCVCGCSVHRFANDPCKAYDTMKWDHLTSLSINNPDQPVTPNKVP